MVSEKRESEIEVYSRMKARMQEIGVIRKKRA
jgi:hypothetical protein